MPARFRKFDHKPRVIVTRRLPQPVETRMAELFDVTLNLDDHPFTRAELAAAMAEAEVLAPTVTDVIDGELIRGAGPQLKLIANFGVGVDHIDLKAARERDITVTNTPGVLTDDTADMVMTLILAVTRRIFVGERLIREGRWTGWSPTGMLGHRIAGRRLGIVGMGRIGQAVAARARAFGLAIHYHNRHRLPKAVEAPLEATWWPTLDAMLERVDIVSLNCPETPETHHIINDARLRLMPRHAFLINVARGTLIDEAALVACLERRGIAGAALDVFEHEPRIHPRLLELPNVVLLPHMGSATYEARQEMGEKVITNIRVFADGHRPPDQVLDLY
ncbi:MAG: D-glycerate dehydrogenase [Sphingomonadaceae bacterium]|uniref:2-hydroxyacid dehydrogenase n=1 Tax=Thermaurantiacus sp. TaxID=2820283 RepID=UPI00298ED150|nr:D-glycerate dehydrogenase [Thermaurantiacus sp.]MCS6987281.1 D-glycerate dehydrogenase [Sphingomonadaceae bacterium]MDW8414501.1 D-glycerate dehydrogenase [Thermaurantiacus sp.]